MIKKLEWDSIFWGKNIFSIPSDFNISDRKYILDELQSVDYDIIQCNVSLQEKCKINFLEKMGFLYQDTKIVFEKILCDDIFLDTYDVAELNDVSELKILSDGLFTYSRFGSYPYSSAKASLFYQTWVENAVTGCFDDICLKISHKKRIIGFVTLRILDKIGSIGLFGVSKSAQQSGIGRKLLAASSHYLKMHKVKNLHVATQGENLPAMNFYIKNKFKVNRIDLWMCLYR